MLFCFASSPFPLTKDDGSKGNKRGDEESRYGSVSNGHLVRMSEWDCDGGDAGDHQRGDVDVHRLEFEFVRDPTDEESTDGIRDADNGDQKSRGFLFHTRFLDGSAGGEDGESC